MDAQYAIEHIGAGDRGALAVAGPDGARLLWAPRGVDAAAAGRRPYDVVVLPVGDATTLAATVAALRESGAVGSTTQVVAVAPSHPVDAGTADSAAARAAARPADEVVRSDGRALGRRVLVLGGARSGKSEFAERLVSDERAVTYVAPSPDRPDDPEWRERVARHRARRPASWTTLETTDVAGALVDASGALLVDCFSLWLASALDTAGAWDAERDDATKAVAALVDDLVDAWRTTKARVVGVSSEVGLGVVPATVAGRRYRDDLGQLNARLAAVADEVWLVTAGIPTRLK